MALKFFWRCEGTTLDGTHDFTAGDNTATLASAAAINTDAARVGTNGLDCPSAADYAEFTISSGDLAAVAEGAAAFSFRVTTWGAGGTLFRLQGTAANDHIAVEMTGTDELIFRHRVSGTHNLTLTTTAANIATGTWYGVVIRWHAGNDDRRIEVYDSSGTLIQAIEDTATAFGPQTDFIALRVGETNGTAADLHVDNVFVADTYAEALESNLTITSYTGYGGGPAAPTVTDVDTDESVTGEQVNVVITGTTFEAAQGAGIVELVDQDDILTQEVAAYDSWSDTSIQVDLTIGAATGVRYGSGKVRVTNASTDSGELAVTITAPSGKNYVDLTTLAPGEDTNSFALAQTYASGVGLTLEAAAASIDPPRRASLTANTNESGTNFTIVGHDENGIADSEVVAGPNNGTVYSDGYWSDITSITPNQTEAVDDIEVGQESLRIYTSPDMVAGDQLEWSNVVGGAIGDVTVNADGTFTTAVGVTAFDVRVHNQTEGWGSIATQNVGSGVTAPTITTTTLPDANHDVAYSETLAATGTDPFVWSVVSGSLPSGLSLASGTGVISGTPDTVESQTFTVNAENSEGSDEQELTIEVLPTAPTVTTTELPAGVVDSTYSTALAADGDGPFTWAVTVGALPTGLSLSAAGVISGTPTLEESQTFTVEATNASGSDTQELSIDILAQAPFSGVRIRVFELSDVTGLIKWTDYVPVKVVATSTEKIGTFDSDGALPVDALASETGSVRGVDHKAVFAVSDTGRPWTTDADGYIPVDTLTP